MQDWTPTGRSRLVKNREGFDLQRHVLRGLSGRSVLQQEWVRTVVTERWKEGEQEDRGFTKIIHAHGEIKKSHIETQWLDVEVVNEQDLDDDNNQLTGESNDVGN